MCNCPSCVSSTNALTRRATVATTRGRLRFGNAFTLFSSSLAATAAFADSKRKDARKRGWERVINETRAEIEAKEADQQGRLAILTQIAEREDIEEPHDSSVHDRGRIFEGQPIRKVHDPYGPKTRTSAQDLKRDSWTDVFEWAAQQDSARAAAGFQDWRGPPLELLQKLSMDQLDELLHDDRLLRRFYGGQDCPTLVDETASLLWSSKKLKTLEWSVAKLVYQFLLQCSENPLSNIDENVASLLISQEKISGKPLSKAEQLLAKADEKSRENEASLSLSETNIYSRLAYVDRQLRLLHLDRKDDSFYEDFESPKLPKYRGGSSHDYGEVRALNRSLFALLHGMEREANFSSLMTKICYNLLTSRNPPNINTYNLLLVRFSQLENKELVRVVLTSMREAHIRPNEVTHATLLRFFTTTNNAFEFKEYLNRMNGYQGGLALTKFGQHISPIRMDTVRSFVQGGAKMAEKARMNGEVYVSLIVGVLKFLSSQLAMLYYRKMISEGWKPDTEVLTAILRHCCYRSEWNAGLLVWEQILEVGHRASTFSYQWMLRLCQVCEQQDMFNQILRDGINRGALPISMLQLPDEMKTQNIAFILEYANSIHCHNVRRIVPLRTRKWIRQLYSDDSNYALENAFQACTDEAAVRAMAERLKATAQAARYKPITASQLLERRLESVVQRIGYTVEAIRRAVPMKSATGLKYQLTAKIKMLEKEEAKLKSHDAQVASNYTKDIKMGLVKEDREDGVAKHPRRLSSENIEAESANDAPEDVAEVAIRPQKGFPERQQVPMIPYAFPTGMIIQDPAPWEDLKRQLATNA